MKITKLAVLVILAIITSSCLISKAVDESKLNMVISAEHRQKSTLRDQYRHPLQTLEFFQVKKEHSVVEILPGGGAWYTEILAPYLREQGTLYAAQYSPDTESKYQKRTLEKFNKKMAANPELYDKIKMVIFNPPGDFQLGKANSVDRVLTFRNVHNWTRLKDDAVLAAFQAFYKVLKPGGKLGVTDHRLPEDREKAAGGYIKQSYVINIAKAAGFELEATSEINANTNDKADYPKGVWTLPPTLALKDQDRDKYLSIGESDRMTLLFVKK